MLDASKSLPPPATYKSPGFALPRGACDSHTHVIPERGIRLIPEATYTPAPAPARTHLQMLDALGLDRGVVVQPSIFGTDNSAVVDAIKRAPERLRGVAVLDPSVSDAEMQLLHSQGIRGVRFNVMLGGGGGLKAMTALAPRLAALGWHAELLVDGHLLPDLAPALKLMACRLVIDHMASLRADVDLDSQPLRALRKLVTERETWVKLSGAYRLASDIRDDRLAMRARTLLGDAPQHMVWGSDWPHVACSVMPDAGELLGLLANWFDADAPTMQRLLTDNPARLFDFPPIEGSRAN